MKKMFYLLMVVSLMAFCNKGLAQKRGNLHEPAARGDLAAVKKVVEKKGNVDKRDIAGQTPLMYAAEGGSLEVVKYLVDQGADVNAMSGNKGRGTALIYATAANRVEIVKYLLEKGANVNLTTPYHKETALVWAVAIGSKDLVKILVANGTDKTLKTKSGETALDLAEKLNNQEIIDLLNVE